MSRFKPEGQGVRYSLNGEVIGVTLINARLILNGLIGRTMAVTGDMIAGAASCG